MDKNILAKIKQAKMKDIIYPVFIILAFLIFILLFISSVVFLLESINRAFGGDEEEYKIVRFDIDGLNRIADRLGIKIE